MKKITCLFLLWLAVGLTACVDDDSQGAVVPLPELSIPGSDAGTMPVYNIYYGSEPLVIDPQVEATSHDLAYEWSVGTYTEVTAGNFQKGELEKVSTDPVLTYEFAQKGTYYVHLTVTDGRVGDVMEYRVNVNDYYEKGILVLANSADGRGNLGFIKELTDEDLASGMDWQVEEHCLERVNPDLTVTTLVGADRTNAGTSPFAQVPVMLVSMEDRCLFVNATTFEVNAASDYASVFDGFRATHFLSTDSYASYPFVYDARSKHSIHFQKAYWFIYKYAYDFYQESFEDVLPTYTYKASINALNLDPLFVNYSTSEIQAFSGNLGVGAGTGELLHGKDILLIIHDKTQYSTTMYVVTSDRSDPLHITQHTMAQAYTEDFSEAYYEESKATSYTASTADGIPSTGTRCVLAQDYQVAFYAIGGGLYAYYLFNASPTLPVKPILSYPAGEEITCIGMNDATGELYVGTYTEATARGNVYIYDIAALTSDQLEPKRSFLQSTDRIFDIRYKN